MSKLQNLEECITWAINCPPRIIKKQGITIEKQKKEAQLKEKEWGNKIIGQTNNSQWTTLLGENLVHDILQRNGENPWKPKEIEGYRLDWETDKNIYEVKTRNWTTSGTAGEKVLGTMYKYSDIPKIINKPLKIVCVAYQEYELTHGTTKIFGDVSETKKEFLDLATRLNIEYIKFSDLVNYKL
jgi:hypothetical protein